MNFLWYAKGEKIGQLYRGTKFCGSVQKLSSLDNFRVTVIGSGVDVTDKELDTIL